MDCPSDLAGLENAFGLGLVLGAVVLFPIGWFAGQVRLVLKPKEL